MRPHTCLVVGSLVLLAGLVLVPTSAASRSLPFFDDFSRDSIASGEWVVTRVPGDHGTTTISDGALHVSVDRVEGPGSASVIHETQGNVGGLSASVKVTIPSSGSVALVLDGTDVHGSKNVQVGGDTRGFGLVFADMHGSAMGAWIANTPIVAGQQYRLEIDLNPGHVFTGSVFDASGHLMGAVTVHDAILLPADVWTSAISLDSSQGDAVETTADDFSLVAAPPVNLPELPTLALAGMGLATVGVIAFVKRS